jgi:hypothetical protein
MVKTIHSREIGTLRRVLRGLALAACLLLGPGPGWAAEMAEQAPAAREPGIAEIEACVTRNLPDDSGRVAFSIEVVDRVGDVTQSRAEILWHRNQEGLERLLVRVSAPAKTAGTSLLMVDQEEGAPDLFVYLPEIAKVKRVRSRRLRGPVLGTDFSYEDLKRLRDPVGQSEIRRLPDRSIDGRPHWVVEARTGEDSGSEYERVLTYVDPEHCLPVRLEFIERDGSLRKVLTAPADGILRHGERWLPHLYVMRDLHSETLTRVRLDRVELNAALSDEQFTQEALLAAGRDFSSH